MENEILEITPNERCRHAREHGFIWYRVLDTGPHAGRCLVVHSMIYNNRVCLQDTLESPFYERAFCYPKGVAAIIACETWDGTADPPGEWIKEVGTERRNKFIG